MSGLVSDTIYGALVGCFFFSCVRKLPLHSLFFANFMSGLLSPSLFLSFSLSLPRTNLRFDLFFNSFIIFFSSRNISHSEQPFAYCACLNSLILNAVSRQNESCHISNCRKQAVWRGRPYLWTRGAAWKLDYSLYPKGSYIALHMMFVLNTVILLLSSPRKPQA